eukprot:TRINITY_DN16418_c0_g1_i1.p1 TRINITY_DN16418_c0_g1~~TRINITY_DN16418_c0_g1_i1.p1  ORF type:complete len:138 (-),score=0.92 TRINITY_DN16418_c0_g1_i1:119-532(-)
MILSFANVKLGNKGLGQIQDESPYVHFRTKFDAQCFCPKVGSYLSKSCGISSRQDHGCDCDRCEGSRAGDYKRKDSQRKAELEFVCAKRSFRSRRRCAESCILLSNGKKLVYVPQNKVIEEDNFIHFKIDEYAFAAS